MPTFTIRNVDPKVRDHLRIQAATHGHSMEAEVRAIWEWHTQRQQMRPGEIARRIQRRFSHIGGGKDVLLPERGLLLEPISPGE